MRGAATAIAHLETAHDSITAACMAYRGTSFTKVAQIVQIILANLGEDIRIEAKIPREQSKVYEPAFPARTRKHL